MIFIKIVFRNLKEIKLTQVSIQYSGDSFFTHPFAKTIAMTSSIWIERATSWILRPGGTGQPGKVYLSQSRVEYLTETL